MKPMVAPRVTVVIPVHNAARFLGEALDSIIRQTYPDLEIVLVDDGSTDQISQVIDRHRDPRLRVIRRAARGGTAVALNDGIQAARGRYVAQMHADDVSLPERLGRQVAFLDLHPDVGFVGGNHQPIDLDGQDCGPPTKLPTLPGHIRWMLHVHNCLNHPTVMARRDLMCELGGYRPDTVPAEDYALWVRAIQVTRIANIPDVVLHYRIHPGSASATRAEAMEARAIQASEEALTRLLSAAPDRDAILILRRPSRATNARIASVRGAAELLWTFTEAVLADEPLEPTERAAIRRAATGWFSGLVRARARLRPLDAARLMLPGRAGPPGWAIREAIGIGLRR
jgi:hypothetical protein